MSRGMVFSIEEFSLYDGPGIRTTVFLKGCPMRCAWCHSPEGQDDAPEWIRSPNGCLNCQACLKAGEADTGVPCLTAASALVCPRHLIRRVGEEYTPDSLVELLLKNRNFLASSGGGVTFSGGEPCSQADFLMDCLTRLRGKMNRAIQTCGFCEPDVFRSILGECDYVLYDLKLIDKKKHIAFCGCDNTVILENYRQLAASGLDFITRIPLIPQVNDTEENISATAERMVQNAVKRVELLPYHRLAGSKYAMMGRTYSPPFDEKKDPCLHMEIWKKYGIEVKVL